jgi:hypothetical protein
MAYDNCEVVYMASTNRRNFIRSASGALILLSTSQALSETTYIAQVKKPPFFGIPAYSLTPGFSLGGVTRTENSIVLTDTAKETIKTGYKNTHVWWNAHRNPATFKNRLSNQISAFKTYELPGWFKNGTGAFASFTELLDYVVKAGRCVAEVKIGLPPLLRVTALALSFGVYLEGFAVDAAELLKGTDKAKGLLDIMQQWATTGFIAQSLEIRGASLVETVYFQEYYDGPVHPLWNCSYTLPTA